MGRVFRGWLVEIHWLAVIQDLQSERTCLGLMGYDIGRLFVGRLPFSLPSILEPPSVSPSSSLAISSYYICINSPTGKKTQIQLDHCFSFEGEVEGSLDG